MNWIFVSLIALSASVFGLDELAAKERKCIDISTSPTINSGWMQSIHKWYFPLWSKLEFYRTASDILEKSVTDMPLSSLENACITWDPSLAATTGLGGLEAKYDLSIDGAGVINFKGKSKYAKSGKHVLTLSDNKNFIVGVTCWDDEEGSYGIWTPKPQLSAGDKEIIVKHLEELGFGMDFMVETPYDKCESERSTDFGEKVEL